MAKRLPATAEEIAAVMEIGGRLGISADDLEGFTEVMINLGETTNLSANDAAVSLARLASILGTSTSKYSNLGSTIVDLGNNFATTESEIAAMAMRIAGAGKQVNLTEADVLGFAAAFSSAGIEAEAGGTAFSTFISKLSLAVAQGGSSLESFAGVVGMTGAEFSEAFGKNAAATVLEFINSLSRSENAIQVLYDLGIVESRQRDALLRAAEASDTFASALDLANSAYAENNALNEEAQKRYDTTASKLDVLKNKAEGFGLGFGKIGKDVLDWGLDVALKTMDKITEVPIDEEAWDESAKTTAKRYFDNIQNGMLELDAVLKKMFSPNMREDVSQVLQKLLLEAGYISESGEKAGQEFNAGLNSELSDTSGATTAIAGLETAITNQASGLSAQGSLSGEMFSSGLASGILNGQSSITDAARKVATSAVNAANETLDIRSPSRVMMKSGGFFDEGFAKGIIKNVSVVNDAAAYMAGMAADAVSIGDPTGRLGRSAGVWNQSRVTGRQAELPPIHLSTYLNGREVSEAMSDDTAYAQNSRSGRIAARYGTIM